MSRKIEDLQPKVQELFRKFTDQCCKERIPFKVCYTLRTEAEQQALYAQGRNNLTKVNELREEAGMDAITQAENHCVTWTHYSKHLTGRAFDIYIMDAKGQPVWESPLYKEAGRIWKSIDAQNKWGGDFKNSDNGHMEYDGEL